MSVFELPSPDFSRFDLTIRRVDPSRLTRIASANVASHVGFRSSSLNRFDSPDGSFGVLYSAFDLKTAFAEAVLRSGPAKAGAASVVQVPLSVIESRRVIYIRGTKPKRRLKLIRLHDYGLPAARTDNRVATFDDYWITQQCAKAMHDHPCNADGVVYISRYLAPRKSVVLFNRCEHKIYAENVIPLRDHPEFAALVDAFKLHIDDTF